MCVWGGIIEKRKKKGREEEERRERGWVGDREMFRNDVIIQKKKKTTKILFTGVEREPDLYWISFHLL